MNEPDLYDLLANATGPGSPEPPLPPCLAGGAPLALYGAGGVGRDLLRALASRGHRVRCFLDQNAAPGASIEGIPVFRPDDPTVDVADRRATPVVITIFNFTTELQPIQENLTRLGWSNVTPFVQIYPWFAAELGDRFWLTSLRFYAGRAAELRAGAGVWADERSRELYDAIVRYRLGGDAAVLPRASLATQYLPDDLPPWRTPLRLVDGGAFDGDTLDRFVQSYGTSLEAVALFEPDPTNLRKLSARIAAQHTARDENPALLLWPCAVHSSTSLLRFSCDGDAASAMNATADTVVQAVSLDEALAGFRPTLIKLDIEGAEPAALLGARRLIEQHRPDLAVCIYHRPEHLWEIPRLVADWNLGYRLSLRLHGENGFDLVLYAIADRASR